MTAAPDIIKWILIALTAGFAVKMAVFPVHMWLPDAHSEAPAPMSALLSGVIISAGAYAILRLSFGIVFPAVGSAFGTNFLYALSIVGVITAFFGSFLALVATDIKRLIAYSSIAHMGYIMFGLSLFPIALARRQPRASSICFSHRNSRNSTAHCHPCRKQRSLLPYRRRNHASNRRTRHPQNGRLSQQNAVLNSFRNHSSFEHCWSTTISMLHQ